jgi:hypothetical protein
MFLMAVVSTPLSYCCSLFLFLFAFVYASPTLYFLFVAKKAVLKFYYVYLYVCHSQIARCFYSCVMCSYFIRYVNVLIKNGY